MQNNRKVLNEGLNADDTDFVVKETEYINAENVRWGTTDKGSTGHIEPVGSTIQLPDVLVGGGVENCIGRVTDEARQRLLYFVHNTGGNHAIYAYDKLTDTARLVLQSNDVTPEPSNATGLNFDLYHLMHSAFIVDDLLYWTDNFNQPRRINTEAGIKLYDGGYTTDVAPYTTPIAQEVIAWIRKPPGLPPAGGKTTVGGITNYVKDFNGQFAYRYVYRDFEESALSPISALVPYNRDTDTFDAINMHAEFSETIEQDVQYVDFCVRYGNSGQFYIVKRFDRDIAADAAAFADHNATITPLNIQFLNDKSGIPLGDAYSIKGFDNVPLLAETVEVAENRSFMGDNLVGYDTPTTTSLTLAPNTETNTVWQNPVFKAFSVHKFGVRFRDKYKRVMGNVVTNDTLKLQIPTRTWDMATYVNYVQWTLSNASNAEIPFDACYYEVVMTRNLRTRFFIECGVSKAQYALKDTVTGVYSYQDAYVGNAYAIAIDLSNLTANGMTTTPDSTSPFGYSFQDGDMARIYTADWSGTPEFVGKVIGADGNYVFIELSNQGSLAGTFTKTVIELYSPYKESGYEPYFTLGNGYLINNPSSNSRSYATISDNIIGDVYIRGYFSGICEVMNIQERYWKEWVGNYGEANFIIPDKQLRKKTAIRWSNELLQGTKVNGMSTFDALDEKILGLECGAIQKLVRTSKTQDQQGLVMLAICENETASMYLGEVQMVGSTSNAFVASTAGVIGTINILKGSHGTLNPESVVEHRGDVYWWDIRNGMIIEYSVNGLDVISDFKLRRFAKMYSDKFLATSIATIEGFGGRPFIFGGVDKYHLELLWSIPMLETNPKGVLQDIDLVDAGGTYPYPYDFYDGAGKTIVYKLPAQKWVGAHTYQTEMFGSIGSELYSLKTALAYRHNSPSSTNTFYGTQYPTRIMLLCNADPIDVKTLVNLAIEANISPSWVHIRSEYPFIQSSDLVSALFEKVEGVWYASVLRDRLSPGYPYNATTMPYEMIELLGDKMRNTAFRVLLVWDNADLTTDFTDFKVITFGYNKSRGQTV